MRRRIAALLTISAVLFVGCGKSGRSARPTTAARSTTTAVAQGGFCGSLKAISSGGTTDLPRLSRLYDQLDANAPAEIGPSVKEFVRLGREISAAFAPLGPNASQDAVKKALDSLSPQARSLVDTFSAAAQHKDIPPGPGRDVLEYATQHCR